MLLTDDVGVPVHSVLELAEQASVQFVSVIPVSDGTVSAALIAIPTERAIPLSTWPDRKPSISATGGEITRAALSEYVLDRANLIAEDRRLREARRRLENVSESLTEARIAAVARDARQREDNLRGSLDAQISDLRRALDRERRQRVAAEQLFRTVKGSSAYQLGSLLGRSVRHPLWAIRGFPRGLLKIIRDRPVAAAQAAKAAEAVISSEQIVSSPGPVEMASRAVTDPHTPKRPGLTIPLSFDAWAGAASVAYVSHPFYRGNRRSRWQFDLVPNNCLQLLEAMVPDAVCIDASSSLPGSPWTGAGTGADPTRTQLLVELIRSTHRYGIPCVFRWDIPTSAAPMLMRVSEICDVIVRVGDNIGPSEAPLLPHGVNLAWFLHRQVRRPLRSVAVFARADLHGRAQQTKQSAVDRIATDWEVHGVEEVTLHKPAAMRHLFTHAGVAVFPSFSGIPLPVLEGLAAGVAVVGPANRHFSEIHDAAVLDWSEESLLAMQQEVISGRGDLVWRIREEFSSLSEARRLGHLLAIPRLIETESVTALIVPDGKTHSEVYSSIIADTTGMIDSVIVAADQRDVGQRVAAVAAASGIRTEVATNHRELGHLVRSVVPNTGWIWVPPPPSVGETPDRILRELLVESDYDAERRLSSQLVAVRDLLGLDDEAIAETLLVDRPMARTAPGDG